MSEQTCDWCDVPTTGAKLCTRCQKTLAVALPNIAAYYDDLGTVAAKATKYGTGAGKGSIGKEQPLPLDARFADITGDGTQVRWDVWNSVTTWVRVVMEEAGDPLTEPACRDCIHTSCTAIRRRRWPRNTVPSMVAYFDRQFRWIVRADWVAQFLDEMLDNERRMRRLVDRPADRWYAGKCMFEDEHGTCMTELYATQGRGFIDCPGCGMQHNVGERRETLLKEAEDMLVSATEAARALLAWTDYDGTEGRLADKISKWRDRDALLVRDVTSLNGRDRHLYRLGDIQDLLTGSTRRTTAKSA